MKIIDKTPLQDQKGEISFSARIQGTLKYGLSWFSDLEAQKSVIALLNRTLEKGYVLIRNFTLPGSDIVIPIILIGSFGMQVILITKIKGLFEAKGDQWNTKDSHGHSQPAGINLIGRVSQYARVLQKYLQFQKIEYPGQIESVLIAADPGAHIDSMRPAARVVQSDAIKQFAASLSQARPVLRPEQVYEIAERIVNPHPPKSPEMEAEAALQKPAMPPPSVSRSQAIFNSEQTPFDPKDLGFAFEDDGQSASQELSSQSREGGPVQLPLSQPTKSRKIMGMTTAQVILLAIMLIVECCVVIGFAVIYSINQ
jgi:hypothetical protein